VSVRAIAAVPAAPMLVAGVSPRQPATIADEVAALRASVLEALRGLPDVDAIVLLTGGEDATLPDGGCVDLAGYGHPQVRADVPVDRELLTAIATRTGTPRVRADVLTGDLAVLTLLTAEARPGAVVVPVTVATAAGAPSLAGFAAGLSGAVDASGRDVAVLAAGDLSASRDTSSPGYLVEGAVDWDEAAVAALMDADVDAFARLGPAEARRVAARGWAPLTVVLTVARGAGLRFARCEVRAPRGVGQLVATTAS
jgi:aromatic ring-opening dioxygenase LigB subunit